MTAIYSINQATVRFWDTHVPTDAIHKEGDIVYACADCAIKHHALPLSHPGVRRAAGRHWCKTCGKSS